MEATRRQLEKLKFGKKNGHSQTGQVSLIVTEYEDVDKLLARLIDDAKSLRESWVAMAMSQVNTATEFITLYQPINSVIPEGYTRVQQPTPEAYMKRTTSLRDIYAELKEDIMNEVAIFDAGVINPGTKAREYIGSFRKTIKKREAKRLDWEKSQDKVVRLQKKGGRTPKEDQALAKAEEEQARFQEEFTIMDNYLQDTLPGVITMTMQLIIPLVSTLASTQYRLLGLSYTSLHTFSEENGYPSPAPPMEEVIETWSAAFAPVQQTVEVFSFIATGKGRLAPLNFGESNGSIPANRGVSPGRLLQIGSSTSSSRQPSPSPSVNAVSTSVSRERSPARPPPFGSQPLAPTDFTAAARLAGPVAIPMARTVSSKQFGHNSTSQTHVPVYQHTGSAPGAAIVLNKRKPPPPPKKKPALKVDEFVIAQYDFERQGSGDLSFRAGDKIKIIKKTATDQDWWEGEVDGIRGSFPANYCKPA